MADNQEKEQQSSSSTKALVRRCCHFEVFRTVLGILKLVEFIVILLGLILVASVSATGDVGAIKFYITVATGGWVATTVHLLLLLFGVYNKLPNFIRTYLVHLCCCGLGVIFFILCSSIVMGKYKYNGTLVAGGACGLVGAALFATEALWFFFKFRREGNVTGDREDHQAPAKSGDEFADPAQPGY